MLGAGGAYLLEVVEGRKDDVMPSSHQAHSRQQLQHQSLGSGERRASLALEGGPHSKGGCGPGWGRAGELAGELEWKESGQES